MTTGHWRIGRAALAATAVATAAVVAACGGNGTSGGGGGGSDQVKGATISVALATDPPPKAMLAEFTKQTGVNVKWTNIDWDSLQTKISAAATSNTYFADATDVDWSRVGEFEKTGWFTPLSELLDTSQLKSDMPQLAGFTVGGKVVGIPYDASFLVTTVNTKMFKQAGADATPRTIAEYTDALRKVKSSGVVKYPLNIPFAAAEGLSTSWYQTTAAFGGTVLGKDYAPQFTSPSSPGYKALDWMVSAFKSGLVAPGAINTTDVQGQQNLMAKGRVASTFGDYSGNVGTLYDSKEASTVTGDVSYLQTPGASGAAGNVGNPDGIGVMKTAKYPKAAAAFIEWYTDAKQQADFAGLSGPARQIKSYTLPSRVSAFKQLSEGGKVSEGGKLVNLLSEGARPGFPDGIPPWYSQFSNAVYTNIHAAAAGQKSVAAAVKAIADQVAKLRRD